MNTTDQEPLSLQLRQSTAAAHTDAEGSDFIKKLFSGACTEQEYYLYLWSLHAMYTALENELEKNKTDTVTALVYFPELFRKESLITDLQEWSNFKTDRPSTLQNAINLYTSHLQKLGKNNPELLVAHAYVRYMGDLSGGQILSKILNRRFTDAKGLNFYNYQIEDLKLMKATYRNNLDQVPHNLSESMCHEADLAFKMNSLIFQALSIA